MNNYELNQKANNLSVNKSNRNFNLLISNEEFDNISITYKLDKDKFWGLSPEFSEDDMIGWITSEKSPLDSREELNKKYDEFKGNKWIFFHK